MKGVTGTRIDRQISSNEAREIATRESARQSRIDEECELGALLVGAHVFAELWIAGKEAKASSGSLAAAARFEMAWRGRYGK